MPRTEVTVDDLVDQITSKKKFSEKMKEIEKLFMDYLTWFEICPISIGQNEMGMAKIQWDEDKDDKEIIKIIARLALLLAHIRGHVDVYKTSEHDDIIIPIDNTNTNNIPTTTFSEGFIHRLPTIENPSRAAQQLYNLARGHALSYGRNYITKDDLLLVIKVVLSTASIERVLVLDLLIANKGTLTTSQITTSMRISNDTAKRTMTEFKGLELVTMERTNNENSNSEYKITLNPKFNWFLTEEFSELRNGFKPTSYKDLINSNSKSKNKDCKDSTNNNNDKESQVCCEENTPCVNEKNENVSTTTIRIRPITSTPSSSSLSSSNTNNKNNFGSHRGGNTRSKDEATTAIVLVKVSDNNKNSPIKMTKEQYDSWAGNENENEI